MNCFSVIREKLSYLRCRRCLGCFGRFLKRNIFVLWGVRVEIEFICEELIWFGFCFLVVMLL